MDIINEDGRELPVYSDAELASTAQPREVGATERRTRLGHCSECGNGWMLLPHEPLDPWECSCGRKIDPTTTGHEVPEQLPPFSGGHLFPELHK